MSYLSFRKKNTSTKAPPKSHSIARQRSKSEPPDFSPRDEIVNVFKKQIESGTQTHVDVTKLMENSYSLKTDDGLKIIVHGFARTTGDLVPTEK